MWASLPSTPEPARYRRRLCACSPSPRRRARRASATPRAPAGNAPAGASPTSIRASTPPASGPCGCRRSRSFVPVGSTSRRPRVGAPEGPGDRNFASRACRHASSSAGPEATTRGRRSCSTKSSTARVRLQPGSGCSVPSMSFPDRSSSRSTVSPQVRHGAVESSAAGCGPCQRSPRFADNGSNSPNCRSAASARIERGVGGFGVAARQPDHRHQEVVQRFPLRRTAEHVQAAPDLHLLQLAEMVVQLRQRGVVVVRRLDATIAVQSDVRGQRQDLLAQNLQPARVHAGCLEVLVDEQLHLRERAVGFSPCERGREVVDDDRLGPALGLGALAGVVDDERVEVWQRTEYRLRKARFAQRQRFAGQPFQVAVLSHVDDGMNVAARCAAMRRTRSSRAAVPGPGRDRSTAGRCYSRARAAIR